MLAPQNFQTSLLSKKLAQMGAQFLTHDSDDDAIEGIDWARGIPVQNVTPLTEDMDEFYAWAEDVGNRQDFNEEDMSFPPFTAEEDERLAALAEETGSMDLICAGAGDVWPAWAGSPRNNVCGDVRDVRLMWALDCSQADAYALWTKDPCIQRALAESPRVFMAWVVEDVIEPEFPGEVGGIRPDWREFVIARCGRFSDWPQYG